MAKVGLFSPGKIGPLYLRNRIIMAPIGSRLTNENGAVTPDLIDFYARRAQGGVGAIVLEAMGIDWPLAMGKPGHVRFHDDSYLPGHAMLTERVHEHGAKIFAMPWHIGPNRGILEGVGPVGPSPVPNRGSGLVPRELTKEEIAGIVDKFAQASRRAMIAGYDGVMLHGGHGYLISSFVSRDTNRRTDEYGGSFENRIRFALEVVAAIRKATSPDYPICLRINGSDFTDDGITLEEACRFAVALEGAGVAALDISAGAAGSNDTTIEPIQYEQGWKLYLAEEIKKHVNIPVIGVGVLYEPEMVKGVIESGRVDFVGIGRELMCEPDWPNKVKAGDDHLLYCIGCNSCFERTGLSQPLRCAVNPLTGRESHVGSPAENRKRVAVIGAGPGGVEAALEAARRGHRVDLYEQADRIGGQLILAATPPGKGRIWGYIEYLEEKLRRSDVALHLNTTFTIDTARQCVYDEIIVASGALCRTIPVPGADETNSRSAWDVLADGDGLAGKDIVVVGAGSVGCETALFAKEQGARNVTIVEMRAGVGIDIDGITRIAVLREMKEAGIEAITNTTVAGLSPGGARLASCGEGGRDDTLPCDLLVIAVGARANNELADGLCEEGFPVSVIGDAAQVGKIGGAVRSGYDIGRAI